MKREALVVLPNGTKLPAGSVAGGVPDGSYRVGF